MEIIIPLIFISLTIAIGFLGLFIWNIKSGQYNDTYTPSVRILFGDKPDRKKSTKNKS
jgi:cbb3-type cytochrome oxidase maturation protein